MTKQDQETFVNNVSLCILCQCSKSTLVQVGVRYAAQLQVRRCEGCGLVFLWPRPTEEEMARYYAECYREDYREPPVQERYQTDLDEARIRVRRLLPLLHAGACLLEVGCGSGAFLDAVRPYVKEVVGVEPDAASRAYITDREKIPVLERVTDVQREGKTFDLVVLFHVLEHVLDPVSFLQSLGQFLRPDGRLVVEVPNIDDVLVAVYQVPAYLRFYYQKAHLYYFSRDTLTAMVNQAGFDATIEGIQRYDLSNHIRWMLTGRPGGQGYYSKLLSDSVNSAYAGALICAGRSDTLWAIMSRRRG